jgi:hypothetical protein
VRAALRDIGKPGGILDAADNLAAGPVQLIVDPALSLNNPNNTTHTAGTTFMGQFFDHDMTFDTTSRLGITTAPEQTVNARTPSLDLDSLYGNGPSESPQLYDARDRAKLRIESGGLFEDVPRQRNNVAIIADPRNDAPAHDVALPLADPEGVPAAVRGWTRRCASGASTVPPSARRSCRSSSRARATASATAWSGRRTARTSRATTAPPSSA